MFIIYKNKYDSYICKRIEKRMEQEDNTPQTLATTGLVYVPNSGTKRDNDGTNSCFGLVWVEKLTYSIHQMKNKIS